jgi:hypothetical protein
MSAAAVTVAAPTNASAAADRPQRPFLTMDTLPIHPIALQLTSRASSRVWSTSGTSRNPCAYPEAGGGALPCGPHFPAIASKVYCGAERCAVGRAPCAAPEISGILQNPTRRAGLGCRRCLLSAGDRFTIFLHRLRFWREPRQWHQPNRGHAFSFRFSYCIRGRSSAEVISRHRAPAK